MRDENIDIVANPVAFFISMEKISTVDIDLEISLLTIAKIFRAKYLELSRKGFVSSHEHDYFRFQNFQQGRNRLTTLDFIDNAIEVITVLINYFSLHNKREKCFIIFWILTIEISI